MQQDQHTIGTENEKSVRPMFFGTRSLKVALKRAPAHLRNAVMECILNKRTDAFAISLANLKRLIGT